MHYFIRCMILFSAILFLASVPRPAFAQHDTHSHPSQATLPGTNPLIEEMMTLDGVYREVVSAVALGDSARVHRALESMHGSMEKTHEGIHAKVVTLPENGKQMKKFIAMDRDFHEELESLDRAAVRKNQREMLRITKHLLERCVSCHQIFRRQTGR